MGHNTTTILRFSPILYIMSHASFNYLNLALFTHVKWTWTCSVKRFCCYDDSECLNSSTTKHRGIVSCFLSGGLHPKSTVGSKGWLRNMPRRGFAGSILHSWSLRIVHTFVDFFPTLNHCKWGGTAISDVPQFLLGNIGSCDVLRP